MSSLFYNSLFQVSALFQNSRLDLWRTGSAFCPAKIRSIPSQRVMFSCSIQQYGQPFENCIPECREEIEKACSFMEQHYAERIYLEQICCCAGLSKSISTKILLVDFQPVEILFLRFFMGQLALLIVYPRRLNGTNRRQELLLSASTAPNWSQTPPGTCWRCWPR